MKSKEIFLEEAVLDDLAHDLDYLELPLSEKAFKFIRGVAISVAVIAAFQIVYLGFWNGDFYGYRALANASQVTTLKSERGIILDRFGKTLASNAPAFRLNLKLAEFFKQSDKQKKNIVSSLESLLSLTPGYVDDLLKNVNLENQDSLTVARKLSVEQTIKIKNADLPGVQVEDDFERIYTEGESFSHILGYMGAVDKNDIKKNPLLSLNEVIGKMGLESYYDSELRGDDGEKINYRNVKGETIDQKLAKEPSAGNELFTTIDSDFQKFFYDAIKNRLNILGSKAGVGIVINPQNGEVLAMVNVPSFDNNEIKTVDLVNPMKPLFNRAIAGIYTPGSTIKPLVAIGALNENVISPEKKILSTGSIEIPNPYNPDEPSRFVDWKAHGWVDLRAALARSSNVYFYEVGGGFENQKGLGIEKLKEYWQKLGLGEYTGIDLPSEGKGFLPDPESKEDSDKGIWRIGDTYNVSIGQGDLLVTPLQLINYISAVANGGKLMKPYMVSKITDHAGNVLSENKPVVIKDYSSEMSSIFKIVQEGMRDGVEKDYGTSHTLADLPIKVAAKTGTSQIDDNTKTNAFFVGYLPAESLTEIGAPLDKQIAILVLIENAREGSLNAVPVAKEVFRWYYENRLK